MILGIGVDVEDVGPFRDKPLEANQRFYERLFSKEEIEYCMGYPDPFPHLAARFCAKEAAVKASSFYGKFLVTHFEVAAHPNAAPSIRPRKNARNLLDFFLAHTMLLSLSHTKNLAVAYAVVTMKRQ